MKYDLVIFDLLNHYYRYYTGLKESIVSIGGVPVKIQGLTGTLRYLHSAFNQFANEGAKRVVLVDNFTSGVARRKSIDGGYKANREYSPEMFAALPYLMTLMKFGFGQDTMIVQCKGYEADDLLPAVLRNLDSNKTSIFLTTDMDWARCLSERAVWYDMKTEWTVKRFKEAYGFHPTEQNIIRYKAYRGDDGDNVPIGLPGVHKAKLLKLIDYGTPQQVFDDLPIIDWMTGKDKLEFMHRLPRIKLNEKLVGFLPIEDRTVASQTVCGEGSFEKTRYACEKLGLDYSELFPELINPKASDPDILFD